MTGFIFDMDGVIVDTSHVWERVDALAFPNMPINRPLIRHLLSGVSPVDGARIILQHLGLTENLESEAVRLGELRKQIAIQLYTGEVGYIPGFPEFFSLLSQLLGETGRTAIATAAQPEYVQALESNLALTQFFGPHIYSIAAVGNKSKPAPDIFLHAAAQIGVDPVQSIVLEDAVNGIQAAKAADMYAIGIATNRPAPDLLAAGADLVVESYAELAEIMLEIKEVSREKLFSLR